MMLHRHFEANGNPAVNAAPKPEKAQEPEARLVPAADISEGEEILPDAPRRTSRRKK